MINDKETKLSQVHLNNGLHGLNGLSPSSKKTYRAFKSVKSKLISYKSLQISEQKSVKSVKSVVKENLRNFCKEIYCKITEKHLPLQVKQHSFSFII